MNRLAVCLSITTLAVLAACGSKPEPEAAAATPAPITPKPAPAPEDATVKMARAVGGGKPGAAVDIRYEFLAKPAVGTPIDLQIVLIPSAGVDAMDVTVNGMEGITVSGQLATSFANVEAGKPYKHVVSVLPQHTGVFYVSVLATSQIGGSSLARTFSIPFVVGTPSAQQKPQPQRDASGEAIEPMAGEVRKE